MEAEPPLPPVHKEQPGTPRKIYLALAFFAFAIASPFIGKVVLDHTSGDTIAALLVWVFFGCIAAVGGTVLTLFGARVKPRSTLTTTAMVVSGILVLAILFLLLMTLLNVI